MRSMQKFSYVAVLCCAAACGAHPTSGGSDISSTTPNANDPSGTSTGTDPSNSNTVVPANKLTVSGTIVNFAFDGNATVNNANNLQVEILNPNDLYPNGTLAALSPTPVKASDCTVTGTLRTCKFSISDVDTSAFDPNRGLFVATADSRASTATGDTSAWQTFATFVQPSALRTALTSGDLTNVSVRMLSLAGHTSLTSVAGNNQGLLNSGLVVTEVTGKDGITVPTGATVLASTGTATPATGSKGPSLFYANGAVNAGSTTGPLSSSGIVVAVPADKAQGVTFAVQAPTGSTESWTAVSLPAASPLWVFVNLSAN